MASVPNFDIDILAKAKRALDRDYAPSDADDYMSPQQPRATPRPATISG